MPRLRIIILEQDRNDVNQYRYALWADVPVARQPFYANASAVSAWKNALTADNTALQDGSVVEKVSVLKIAPGSTVAQIETFLQQTWTLYQAEITAANPWVAYGSNFDGTVWTITGVA